MGRNSSWCAPIEKVVKQYVSRASRFWDNLVEQLSELQFVVNMKPEDKLPDEYRSVNGGNLLFRPILPLILTKALKNAMTLGMSEDTFLSRFCQIPKDLNRSPWRGVLWTDSMVTRSKNQNIAERLILWMVNADPEEKKIKAQILRRDIANLQDKSIENIQLPDKIVKVP